MIRVFSNNVFSKVQIEHAKKNGVELKFDKKQISFTHKLGVNEVAKLPTQFYFEQTEEGILLKTEVNNKHYQNVFYHKITGTYKSLFRNSVEGFIKPYVKKIKIVGAGYRSDYAKDTHEISVFVGYAHPVTYKLQSSVSIKLENNGTEVTLSSYNKQDVTQDASKILRTKKINVYSGTGIHDMDKRFVKKEVKKV